MVFVNLLGLSFKLFVKLLQVIFAFRGAVKIDKPLPQVVPCLGQLELFRRIALGVRNFDLGQIALQPPVAVAVGIMR